jgi:NitT/TauT family transport system ATP-binding protein
MSNHTLLRIKDLTVTFPDSNGGLEVLNSVNLDVAECRFVAVLGPSGSGKTTLLRVIAGLLPPTNGSVQFNTPKGNPPRIGLMFQQANLMPWRTAIENITLPLEMQGVHMGVACDRAREFIELVGLDGFENSLPRSLSGGMAQRVALARALIMEPDVLLLDEPFGALDALTRERMGAELLHIWQARETTVMMVTHSIAEALLLSDHVVVLSARPGRVVHELDVPFPRPRTDEIRYSPEFTELTRDLRASIQEEPESVPVEKKRSGFDKLSHRTHSVSR